MFNVYAFDGQKREFLFSTTNENLVRQMELAFQKEGMECHVFEYPSED